MVAAGIDDHTVMALSGHSSTRLGRYTHPTVARKVDELETFSGLMGRIWAEHSDEDSRKVGGRQEARTPDLRVANAALSQLS